MACKRKREVSKKGTIATNLTARPASIEGKGVGMITLISIKAGGLLWTNPHDETPENSVEGSDQAPLTKEQQQLVNDHYCCSDTPVSLYRRHVPLVFDASTLTNHSSSPNAIHATVTVDGFTGPGMVALRDLVVGTEVLQDFALTCYEQGHRFLSDFKKGDQSRTRLFRTRILVESQLAEQIMVNTIRDKVSVATDGIPPKKIILQSNFSPFPIRLLPMGTKVWFWEKDGMKPILATVIG